MEGATKCFDTRVYKRTLDHMKSMGFDVADQRTKKLPETRYYCSSDVMGRLIDMNTRQVGLGIEDAPDLWVSKMHNAYKTTNLTDLPVGVTAILGGNVSSEGLDKVMYQGIKKLYQCFKNNDDQCVQKVSKVICQEAHAVQDKQ